MTANFFKAYLASSLAAGTAAATITLDRVTNLNGETIVTADFTTLGRGIITVNPEGDGLTSYPENISFTAVSGNTLTGAVRGLNKNGTTTTSLMRYHPVGTPIIISFGAHNIQDFITYVQGVVAGTIGTATTTVAGSTKMSIAPVSPTSPISIGDNDPRIPQNTYTVDAVGTDSYAVTLTTPPAAYAAGQQYLFKAGTSNTGACTLNVNGLGAKTIKDRRGNDLGDGDIASGQVVCVIYDGTNMRIIGRESGKFGGTGVDGALSITSGTTTLSFASAQYLIKNYTSVSITGTGVLGFSNPHANGSIFIMKVTGDVTVTSSANPAVDLRLMGAAIGTNGTSTGVTPTGGIANAYGTATYSAAVGVLIMQMARAGNGAYSAAVPKKSPTIFAGAGGATGSSHANTGGVGGMGGGGLYIECGGSLNITSVFNASGQNGSNGVGTGGGGTMGSGGRGGGGWLDSTVPGCLSTAAGDGGGGGGGGSIVILYGTLTANTATLTVGGGVNGSGAVTGSDGTSGGDGYSFVAKNTEIV